MYTQDELNIEGIRQWDWIKDEFKKSSILLGNGFSINFSDTLIYKNLYDFFITKSSVESKGLFEAFETRNFEHVLESIETAKTVCTALKIETTAFETYKKEVREGLIDSINTIHPRPISVDYDLVSQVAKQFTDFNQIFTTNYDLFLYYIVLETKKFGDHFFNAYSQKYKYFGEPDQMNNNHIYFLHGALFLFESGLTTLKILRPTDGWLLNRITDEIAQNNYPLFISEGKSETKLKSIQSNRYLNFALNQFEKCSDKKLVIYGQSLSEQDEHLAKIIDKSFEKIAISIRPQAWKTMGELKAEKSRLSSYFKKTKLEFYDSTSLFKFT
ncbi:MAG: DUF4917 family protein [Bacteroidota bacterium]|nr:DUF4917 family protein [Bacteroidota bacterium]